VLGAIGLAAVDLAACSVGSPARRAQTAPVAPGNGYADRLVADLRRYLAPTADHPDHPAFPGAVVLTAANGAILAHRAVGDAVRYGANASLLPAKRRVPARPDTIYDLASLTKVFTAVVVLSLVERGLVELDEQVGRYLPEFGKPEVTVRALLTHTSGLPGDVDVTRQPDPASRFAAILATPLAARPGTRFVYSDVGFVVLGVLAERVTGRPLDALVGSTITGPLGMRDTMFRPPAAIVSRVAATEYMPWTGRGVVRGQVHDELGYVLGGVSGHAGLFSTAAELALFAQALTGGRILGKPTVATMLTNANPDLGARAAHGLGVELNQSWYMGSLAGPRTFGHTGFTGTSLVVDPDRGALVVLLSNRVHPDRRWGGINPVRQKVADGLVKARILQ
jgi:CubicO group peptidase (beta-lactamase class C family)